MKRVMLFITVLICAAAAVLLVGCTKKAGPHIDVDELPGSGSDVLIRELTFSEDFDASSIKDTAMIYKAYPVEVTEEYIGFLAEKMQMSGSTVNDDGQSLRVSDGKGNSIVIFKASGSIFCSFSDRAAIVDSELEALYTDEEYCAAAREWIESAGLLTDEYDVEDVRIADNGFVTKTVGEKEERYPTLKTVTYMRRDLDGLGFSGAAPRIIVDLSLDGKVVGVTKLQRAFEPFEEYPLTEIENAVRKLENGEGVFYRSGNTSDTGVIDSAELMYYNREAMDSSTYLIPVYVLHGTSGEGQFTAVVIAVDENCYTVTGTSAAGQPPTETTAEPAVSEPAQAGTDCSMPLYFDSADALIDAVSRISDPSYDGEPIVIMSAYCGSQSYNGLEDPFELGSIGELYAPKANEGDELLYIRVTGDYVAFCYGNADGGETKNFVWLRRMAPESAYNELEGRGAAVRTVEDGDVVYALLEWTAADGAEKGGCTVQFALDGKVFQANYAAAEADEQMLDFCRYSTAPIK